MIPAGSSLFPFRHWATLLRNPHYDFSMKERAILADDCDRMRALLREAWEFPEYPGPGEGLVSTEDDYAAQEAHRVGWIALDARVKKALR